MSEIQKLEIRLNKQPLKDKNSMYILLFEWVFILYYCFLIAAQIHSKSRSHYRIMLYSICFFIFQGLQITYRYLQIQDPLHLNIKTGTVIQLIIMSLINMLYLLVRIVIQYQNIHSIIMMIHFLVIIATFFNKISKSSSKVDIGIDTLSFQTIINPIVILCFSKAADQKLSDFQFIEIPLILINFIATVEIKKIIAFKECFFFGWYSLEENNKKKSKWSRKNALRSIIVLCCILIVCQNLLLILQEIKYQISIIIVHTFLISLTSYLLYSGFSFALNRS